MAATKKQIDVFERAAAKALIRYQATPENDPENGTRRAEYLNAKAALGKLLNLRPEADSLGSRIHLAARALRAKVAP